MSSAADTSVVLPALLSDHDTHQPAADALGACTATVAHVALEAYSVLTRLPPPHRAEAATAAAVLKARLPHAYLTLSATSCAALSSRLAAAGVSGGSAYDGLIALTALEHEIELVSRDTRAARTYRALGVRFRLLA
ncbi:MAG TPA: PIN domain-containing protein [Solirubrobacteraceae bacterium]